VQDRYVADVGDFAKLGLLRILVLATPFYVPFRLAVIWYLICNEMHNSDGRHIQYLDDHGLRICDPELHERLKLIVRHGVRNIQSLESSVLLPRDRTIYHSINIPEAVPNEGRRQLPHSARHLWFSEAVKTSETADVVFLDPDNGLAAASIPYWSVRAVKYAFLEEVRSFVDRAQSVLLYQHHHRRGSTDMQVRDMLERLRPLAKPEVNVLSFTFRRGSVRSFYLIPARPHLKAIRHNVGTLINGPWASFFSVSEL
jgi:hypothetical protein